ncbi:MAG TPA: ATP-binding protein [Dehalococcoidia bacterium]|nr:ATP-binding protein [Dehalococcoidia bacterium]
MEGSQLISDVQLLTDGLGELPEPVVKPAFVAVSGLPGTGKSYFCSKLVERLPLVVLESDALRRELFSAPSHSSPESARLFRALHLLIERLLKQGISLILDATNLSERNRERLYNIADRLGARLILVRVEAPPEVVYQRLQARAAGDNNGSSSDADWAVYQRMRSSVQKIARNHYAVDTSRDISPVLDKIVREVRR